MTKAKKHLLCVRNWLHYLKELLKMDQEKTFFLLTHKNGIANYFYLTLFKTGQTKKACYFRETIQIWNPADSLDRSLMATSAAFYCDEQKAIMKYADLPYDEFRPLMVKIFKDWYNYQLRKQSNRYKRNLQHKLKGFTDNHLCDKLEEISMEELMRQKSIFKLIADYVEHYADEREQFIYKAMIGLEDVVYDDAYRYVLNYPNKRITRQTYINHKKKFIQKLRSISENLEK
jgi:hypothetical protein